MKKALAIAATALIAASALCGCAKDDANEQSDTRLLRSAQPQQVQTEQDNTDSATEQKDKNEVKILIYDGKPRRIPLKRTGNYTVEYIHTPYGMEKDDTLDYNLTLNTDNTFYLTVVSDGVTAEHSGRWYELRNQIMMFYDEQIDPPQHNVYVADCLCGELLPEGKIMIYDNCYTIVLSRKQSEIEFIQTL